MARAASWLAKKSPLTLMSSVRSHSSSVMSSTGMKEKTPASLTKMSMRPSRSTVSRNARPIPPAAPVTSATFPLRSISSWMVGSAMERSFPRLAFRAAVPPPSIIGAIAPGVVGRRPYRAWALSRSWRVAAAQKGAGCRATRIRCGDRWRDVRYKLCRSTITFPRRFVIRASSVSVPFENVTIFTVGVTVSVTWLWKPIVRITAS